MVVAAGLTLGQLYRSIEWLFGNGFFISFSVENSCDSWS